MIYICIIFFIVLIISFIVSGQSILAPAVIVSGIWFICTLCYLTLNHKLYPVSDKFLIAISVWVLCFCLSSLLIQSLKIATPFRNTAPSKIARDIYFYISLCTLPFLVFDFYVIMKSGLGGNLFHLLRVVNVFGLEKKGIERTSSFFVVFWLVSYIIELTNYSKQNKNKVFLLLLMNVFFALISMAKTNFLMIFLSTISILYFKKKITFKNILIGTALLFVFFIGIQIIRDTNNRNLDINGFVSLYLLAGIPAFDTINPASSIHFGENVFRLFYAITQKIGLSSIKPVDPILKFISVPVPTNVYTVLYPYYKDFGLIGVGVFASFLGFIFGGLFNKIRKNDQYALTIYALLIICLVMQFIGDIFFTVLSQNLQYIIISYIPFFITKHQLFEKKS